MMFDLEFCTTINKIIKKLIEHSKNSREVVQLQCETSQLLINNILLDIFFIVISIFILHA